MVGMEMCMLIIANTITITKATRKGKQHNNIGMPNFTLLVL